MAVMCHPYHRFKGFGTVTANNTTRLLLDYKEEHPEKYLGHNESAVQ